MDGGVFVLTRVNYIVHTCTHAHKLVTWVVQVLPLNKLSKRTCTICLIVYILLIYLGSREFNIHQQNKNVHAIHGVHLGRDYTWNITP